MRAGGWSGKEGKKGEKEEEKAETVSKSYFHHCICAG